MSNRNYIKGRAAEYKTMRLLKKEGYYCFRAAGSHSPFDIIAFLKIEDTELPIIKAIQCKAMKYIAKKDIEELKSFTLPLIICKEIWHYQLRKKPKIIIC